MDTRSVAEMATMTLSAATKTSGWYFWRQGRCYAPQETTLSEDERQELVATVAEAHAGLREVAFKLRRC